MKAIDYLQEVASSIQQNKVRTLLTAFGVFWGMLFLVVLLGGGAGLQNSYKANFTSDLRDSIWYFSQHTSIPYAGMRVRRPIEFTMDDVAAIRREIPGIKYVSAESPLELFYDGNIVISHKGKSGVFGAFGVADDYFKIKVYQDYLQGRRLNALDSKEQRKVVVIGTKVADAIFTRGSQILGQQIEINGVPFSVVGVFYDSGWNGKMSERAYIPMSTLLSTFGDGRKVKQLTAAPKDGVDGFELEKQITQLLYQRHQIAPNDKSAMLVHNLLKQSRRIDTLFLAIDVFVWFVGLGTLLAGIVGISNVMLISVKERSAEIGLRKALGAKSRSVVAMILVESALVTTIAGYLGLAAGVVLLELVSSGTIESISRLIEQPSVDFQIALIALLILVCSGLIAGVVPAVQASRVSPTDAMRQQH